MTLRRLAATVALLVALVVPAAAQATEPDAAADGSNAATAGLDAAREGRPDDDSWKTPANAAKATRAARASSRLRNLLALRTGERLAATARPLERGTWGVTFARGDTPVILVEVTPDGDRVLQVRGAGLNVMPGLNRFRGTIVFAWAPWLVSLVAFVLVLAPRRGGMGDTKGREDQCVAGAAGSRTEAGGWRIGHPVGVGALALLAVGCFTFIRFGDTAGAWVALARAEYVAAFLLLVVLLALMAWRLTSSGDGRTPAQPLLPGAALWTIAALFAVARLAALATDATPSDVPIAGATGAELMLGGAAVYGSMPNIPGHLIHGDTYGPLNYVAYAPAQLVMTRLDPDVSYEAVGLVTAAWSDLLCALLVVVVARRLLAPGWDAAAAAAWMTWPLTGFSMLTGTNDALLAAGLLAVLAVAHSPVRRGAVLAAAAAVKFAPVLAAGAIVRVAGEPLRRSLPRVVLGAALVAAGCAAYLARYDDGFREFYRATVEYQSHRDEVASMWGLLGIDGVRRVLQWPVVMLLATLFVWPRRRDARTVAAAIALAMIAGQLVLRQWWYPYAVWFFGPALIALLPARTPAPGDAGAGDSTQRERGTTLPAPSTAAMTASDAGV